eukprot:Rhum_TRINITY_DN23649_c0_g1::Rhum_TRINITY_DN23649_c0_g1_i1::g.178374::m.178374
MPASAGSTPPTPLLANIRAPSSEGVLVRQVRPLTLPPALQRLVRGSPEELRHRWRVQQALEYLGVVEEGFQPLPPPKDVAGVQRRPRCAAGGRGEESAQKAA